jgi:hypothetical protein
LSSRVYRVDPFAGAGGISFGVKQPAESKAMSDESEVDKVLSRAGPLEQALGKGLAALVLLFALWTMRPRSGLALILTGIGLAIAGWLKLRA